MRARAIARSGYATSMVTWLSSRAATVVSASVKGDEMAFRPIGARKAGGQHAGPLLALSTARRRLLQAAGAVFAQRMIAPARASRPNVADTAPHAQEELAQVETNNDVAYGENSLPAGIRSRFLDTKNGCILHVLEAGYESPQRPCVLLLH